jgi:hypothetical protein
MWLVMFASGIDGRFLPSQRFKTGAIISGASVDLKFQNPDPAAPLTPTLMLPMRRR